jgi:hypothetical protein
VGDLEKYAGKRLPMMNRVGQVAKLAFCRLGSKLGNLLYVLLTQAAGWLVEFG